MELELQICLWLGTASIKEVAEMFDLSWDEVAGIQERAVNRVLARRSILISRSIVALQCSGKSGELSINETTG